MPVSGSACSGRTPLQRDGERPSRLRPRPIRPRSNQLPDTLSSPQQSGLPLVPVVLPSRPRWPRAVGNASGCSRWRGVSSRGSLGWANLPPDPAPLVIADNWIYVHELQRDAAEARIRAQQGAAALAARKVGEGYVGHSSSTPSPFGPGQPSSLTPWDGEQPQGDPGRPTRMRPRNTARSTAPRSSPESRRSAVPILQPALARFTIRMTATPLAQWR
jgi:hypothetical protein